MLKKTLSGVLAVAIGVALLLIDRKEVFVIGVAIVSAFAVYEILVATKYIKAAPSAIICIAFAAAVPFVLNYDIRHMQYVAFVFIVGLFLAMVMSHRTVKFAQMSLIAFVSLCIPFSLSCLVFIYDLIPPEHRTFILLYTCVVTWVSDSGAYFAGTLFGKHKMAPGISPKKTWEGFAGGLLISATFGAGLALAYQWAANAFLLPDTAAGVSVNIVFLALLAIPCAMLGVVGDLSASVLKRECSVKDFGNVLPAHGGFLDRFDSVLFAAPFAYLVFLEYVPITTILEYSS
ncbi:MAG: phosphatidate cytidylyltransferase [Oscillospiraceae bacterium]|nr:phosphatidate cytidylyltransferase [Oscillospiraceae bacterium]